jgi:hypothetical protein
MFRFRWQHVMGLVVGALLGAVAAGLGHSFDYALSLNDGLLWGAVIGGILAGVPQFAQSGAVLTGSESRAWNLAVGIAGSLVFLGVVVVLVFLALRLLF